MADFKFTDSELQYIAESPEFKNFMTENPDAAKDGNGEALKTYLQNESVREEWVKRCSERRQSNDKDEDARERSDNSDQNDFRLDELKLEVLHDMEKISDDVYEKAKDNPAYAMEQIQNKLPMSEKDYTEFQSRLGERMISDDELLPLIPPAMLAEQYTLLQEKNADENNHDKEADSNKLSRVEQRIDELTHNLYESAGLYYADVTNISDTYEGYKQMFDAREKYMKPEVDENGNIIYDEDGNKQLNPQDEMLKGEMDIGRELLEKRIHDYDDEWHLSAVNSDTNAKDLDHKFDDLNKELKDIELDDETLALVSNFKFLDNEGNPEPQFTDSEGNSTDTYEEGAKVTAGSELENVIRVAKQNVLLRQLGAEDKASKEDLAAALKEEVTSVLYAAHVADLVEQGVKEQPEQFTDPQFKEQFLNKLADIEHPMAVSNTAYEATIDNCINTVGGYAHRLGSKVGKNQDVVMKVFEPLRDLDKRATDRITRDTDKRKTRIEMLKRTAKGALSAFMVSGAITVAGTAAATDAGLTAATGGLNKLAGMALGSALAVGLTARQLYKWRQQRKKEGKAAGLKALVKDRRMLMTVGTTALGTVALGCAITGNPGMAQALGYGALAMGSGNGIINNYQDAVKQGLSKKEAIAWTIAQAGATIVAVFAGRAVANAGIDAYNSSHPDDQTFQHKVKIGEHVETSTETTTEVVYKDGVVEHAQKILDYWYKDNPDLLQQRIDAINDYNAAHGTDINPQRYLLLAHDSGALSADNNLMHVQGGPDVHSHANHTVFGQGWSDETGVSQDMVKALAGSVDGNAVNIDEASINAFRTMDSYVNQNNQVGYVPHTPEQNDGVLGYNAEMQGERAVSTLGTDKTGEMYRTYADHNGPFEQRTNTITHEKVVEDFGNVRNQSDLGVGMFGVLGNMAHKLKDRAGSLLDRITRKKREPEPPVITPDPVPPIITPEPINISEPEQQIISPEPEAPVVVTVTEPPVTNFEPEKEEVAPDKPQSVDDDISYIEYVRRRMDSINPVWGAKISSLKKETNKQHGKKGKPQPNVEQLREQKTH